MASLEGGVCKENEKIMTTFSENDFYGNSGQSMGFENCHSHNAKVLNLL